MIALSTLPPRTKARYLAVALRNVRLRAAGGPGSGWTAENGHVAGSQGGLTTNDTKSFETSVASLYAKQGVTDWEEDYFGGLKLRSYFGSSESFRVNEGLRGGKSSKETKVIVEKLNDGLKESGVDIASGQQVHRAVSGAFADQLLAMKPGDSFEDKGWVSTAALKSNTTRFGNVRMQITTRTPLRALIYKKESEILFAPGRTFKVTGTKVGKKETVIMVDLT